MLCVIARIDEPARQQLLLLQQVAAHLGVPPRTLYGHMTLAIFVGDDETAFIDSCKCALNGRRAFGIRYEEIITLASTGVIAAAPGKSPALAELQHTLAQPWLSALDPWTQPDVWQPHTTLVHLPRADLTPIAQVIRADFSPFPATIRSVEFSRVSDDGYKIVGAFSLLDT